MMLRKPRGHGRCLVAVETMLKKTLPKEGHGRRLVSFSIH